MSNSRCAREKVFVRGKAGECAITYAERSEPYNSDSTFDGAIDKST